MRTIEMEETNIFPGRTGKYVWGDLISRVAVAKEDQPYIIGPFASKNEATLAKRAITEYAKENELNIETVLKNKDGEKIQFGEDVYIFLLKSSKK